MSNYANYEDISRSYDKSRKAAGVEILLAYLNTMHKPIQELKVLDAGCGTGNYAKIIGSEVGQVVCCDINEGMLACAQKKIKPQYQDKFEFLQLDMMKLPFGKGSFDVIICNQSLHHTEIPNGKFLMWEQFFKNAYSLLNNSGRLIVNTITHNQLEQGVWWAELIQPAIEHTKKIFPDNTRLIELFKNSGFEIIDKVVPFYTLIQEDGYTDPNSIKDISFRRGDSHFSLLTYEQLDYALTTLAELQSTKKIDTYLQQREELRLLNGQFSYYITQKV